MIDDLSFILSGQYGYDNIFHRTCKQLAKFLRDNGFPVKYVSRTHIGEKYYYHIDFDLTKSDWSHDKTSDYLISELLDVKNIGLADFFRHDDMIHEVILIDEDELNSKYLKEGNLVFKNDVKTKNIFII